MRLASVVFKAGVSVDLDILLGERDARHRPRVRSARNPKRRRACSTVWCSGVKSTNDCSASEHRASSASSSASFATAATIRFPVCSEHAESDSSTRRSFGVSKSMAVRKVASTPRLAPRATPSRVGIVVRESRSSRPDGVVPGRRSRRATRDVAQEVALQRSSRLRRGSASNASAAMCMTSRKYSRHVSASQGSRAIVKALRPRDSAMVLSRVVITRQEGAMSDGMSETSMSRPSRLSIARENTTPRKASRQPANNVERSRRLGTVPAESACQSYELASKVSASQPHAAIGEHGRRMDGNKLAHQRRLADPTHARHEDHGLV